jgi:hypothetical protein
MRTARWIVILMAAALAAGAGAALAELQPETAQPARAPKLTPEEKAVVERAEALRKETRITRLELALMEAKEAPEGTIATKAEELYRLQGRMHALRAKHPELMRELRRHVGRQVWRHRQADGRGGAGPAWGPQGPGRWMGAGRGPAMRQQRPPAMGPGVGQGWRRGMAREFGRGVGEGIGEQWRMGRRGRDGMGMRGGLEELAPMAEPGLMGPPVEAPAD